jgi:hypothetical protein
VGNYPRFAGFTRLQGEPLLGGSVKPIRRRIAGRWIRSLLI